MYKREQGRKHDGGQQIETVEPMERTTAEAHLVEEQECQQTCRPFEDIYYEGTHDDLLLLYHFNEFL